MKASGSDGDVNEFCVQNRNQGNWVGRECKVFITEMKIIRLFFDREEFCFYHQNGDNSIGC